MLASVPIQLQPRGRYRILYLILNKRQNFLLKIKLSIRRQVVVDVPLKLLVRKLVSWLVFSIVISGLLYSIISQVNVFICDVFEVVGCSRGTEISVKVEIALDDSIDSCYQSKATNVELSSMN
jgi:hypothetical protein